ncbi:glycoside hydrolase family 125 protein [Paenibacillus arenosi]|uniref:Glycoside hydrolase family 125 protein n=1 Tax=Paenibacillus arenosi TaxID=2774142 RepID=A0ABR9AVI7_9BACL|nr:glycoside hydrolase family 125 protein [Paenibacillus arenosi]MBD8498151.1 glycoside hydrolase family 125 protein [Paenibacillus arenosi]
MERLPQAVLRVMEEASTRLNDNEKLKQLFLNCFPNTLKTTTKLHEDGTSYVFTGDIPAMWLRDSSAQVRQYLPLAAEDADVRRIIAGLVRKQLKYIQIDPYANAFNETPVPLEEIHHRDITELNGWVWERKYEIDSLCYPIQLGYLYWKTTGDASLFDSEFRHVAHIIMNLWTTEQRHFEQSSYRFQRQDCRPTDTLKNNGMGMPVNYTGMTWSAFRPSDDACTFGYLIPSNMFAVVVLRYLEEIARDVYQDELFAEKARRLGTEIDEGIQAYGIFHHPKYGKVYAYETDGYGNHNLMDDANVPSLLAIPYLGYTTADDPIYQNTRKLILSEDNPYYYAGKQARGIGSPHTPKDYIWHIALSMQGLTAATDEEIQEVIAMLVDTDAELGYMHEGFHKDDAKHFTREWFAWSNSLFSELIYREFWLKK